MPAKTKPSTPPPKPEKPKRNPRGRIPGEGRFAPTPEQRQLVLQAVGFQIPQEHICQLILHPKTGLPISETTLKLRFAEEIARGSAKTKVLHGMALWKAIQAGNVTAMIWWDKTRNRIGTGFNGRDAGEEAPNKPPPIEADSVDIVVIARRIAFAMAKGAAHAKAAERDAKPVKATSTGK